MNTARLLLLTSLLLPLTACASMVPRHIEHGAFLGASAADTATTRAALGRGAQEINPILGDDPSTAKLVGLKLAGWMVLSGLEAGLERQIGRELSWWERVLYWAVPTGLAAWAAQHNAGVCQPACN